MAKKAKVVIVGAGFGGLWATRRLSDHDVDITLIDRNNYHAFLPLLYQVAAAEIEPEQIAYPVRSILRQHPNVNFMMAAVTGVDFVGKRVLLGETAIDYDFLILATGSKQNFFGVDGAEEHAYAIKSIDESVDLRHQVLRCFERAAIEPDEAKRRALLTFAIVGGGSTGVEYAGALSELINRPLKKDFTSLNFDEVRVVLLEGSDRLLAHMPERLSAYTVRKLRSMGVDVQFKSFVKEVRPNGVLLNDGAVISAETTIWTAGVLGADIGWELPTGKANRVAVKPTLQVPNLPNVYAVGDLAYIETGGQVMPMLCQPAMQEGEWAADNILRTIANEPLHPFEYKDLGTMTTIGRNAAVAHVGRFKLTGFIAWIMWVVIHLVNLIGFRNRLVVLISWAWDYFFFERVARLILEDDVAIKQPPPQS